MPTPATNLGSVELARRVKQYQRPTSAKRGPSDHQNCLSCIICNARTGRKGDEEHKDRAFRVAVANRGRDRGKPFFGVALDIAV